MQSFKDGADRTWTLAVTVDAVKRVRKLVDVDLVDVAVGGDLWTRLLTDPVLLVDVLYVLLKPEADTLKISDVDFGRSLVGDAISEALAALQGSLLDFFPRHQRVRAAANLLTALREIDRMLTEAKGILESAPAPTSGGSSGNAPESAASPPDP